MATAGIIQGLAEVRTRFDRAGRERRRKLLADAARRPIQDAKQLREYHDLLLFVASYPDDQDVLRRAERELARVGRATGDLPARALWSLRDSGMTGTTTTHAFTLDMATWLSSRCDGDVELDWSDEAAVERLEALLPHLAAVVEGDGLLNKRFDTRQWVDAARGRTGGNGLSWLVRRLGQLPGTPAVREKLFETLEFELTWRHRHPRFSRTGARFPERAIHFQRGELTRGADLREVLNRSMRAAQPLSRGAAARLLDGCRAALSSRRRETDPLTYANEREVYLLRLENGVDVAVFGMTPARRLPIESFFGYVAARNRVPMAYGGGWVLGRRCEIGVNIFDEFRGGASALLFAQIIRVYRHLFDVTRFLVDPFQFGADNEEAIRSGAFWFYYRLGFRPLEPDLRRLAESEVARIRESPGYRSTPRTLRRLATGRIAFDVDDHSGAARDVPGDFDLAELGMAVTHLIGKRFRGDRAEAEKWAVGRAMKILKVHSMAAWREGERESFRHWSLLIALVEGIARWPQSDRTRLLTVMRSKGGTTERQFAVELQRLGRLLSAFKTISQSAARHRPRAND